MARRSTTLHDLGIITVEHELDVPLDHADATGETLTIFAREVADPEGRDKPFLLFLQGGPGHEGPNATGTPRAPGWLGWALQHYRVLLLDQRGTGRSSPVGPLTLPDDPQAQATRLVHYRADSIVRDAELLREALRSEPWTVLGQSFGGLCAFTYLSIAPDGLRAALVTGGVPGIGRHVDEVFTETYAVQARLAADHHARYPGDVDRLRALHERVDRDGPIELHGGDRLGHASVRLLGRGLGMSDGSALLHQRLELPVDGPAFRTDAADPFGVGRNPLYALVHEACWADGGTTRWSAGRLEPDDEDPARLLGEHPVPAVLDDVAAFAPLRAAADLLADHEWGPLYDEDVLARNAVPVAAAVYTDDPYVPHRLSMETVRRFPGVRAWETSEFLHNGLRVGGPRLLEGLRDLALGRR